MTKEFKDFKAEVVKIDKIIPHPNADKLEIAKVKGWQVVVGKEQFKVGDVAVYIPVDSILTNELEARLFSPDSKIKLSKSRVRAIKIRKFVSQGMLETFDRLGIKAYSTGCDLTDVLKITKYEPPVPQFQSEFGNKSSQVKKENPFFKVYSKFPRIQNYPNMFDPDEEVVVTEKIHGTNFRAGWVPYNANTLWKKIKKFFGIAPEYEFVYGTHYTELVSAPKENVYEKAVKCYNLETIIPKGFVIYGEIYGPGIQKGYDYGEKETKLIVFDIQLVDRSFQNKYTSFDVFTTYSSKWGLPSTPVLYRGKFKNADLNALCQGPSVLAPCQKVREGCVVKPVVEGDLLPRKGAKVINPEYLIRDNTDFH